MTKSKDRRKKMKRKYFKIVNPKGHNGLVYHEGYNEDPLPFNPSGDCKKGGIYFARDDIFWFLDYGTDVYEVEPIGEVYENPGEPKKYKAHAVNLKYVGKWSDVETMKVLVEDGADDLDVALRIASDYGHINVVKYLVEQGADNLNYALQNAAVKNRINVVKYLVEQGADGLNGALWYAADYGYLNVVKYLVEQGANNLDEAIVCSSGEVRKYLKKKRRED